MTYEALCYGRQLQIEPARPFRDYITWLRQQDMAKAEGYWREYLGKIGSSARLLTELIEDILDVSRIVSGKLKLEVRPTDLASVVESAVESALPAAQARDIRLQRVLDSGSSMVSGAASVSGSTKTS